jgi:hypothetical protein
VDPKIGKLLIVPDLINSLDLKSYNLKFTKPYVLVKAFNPLTDRVSEDE